MTPTCFVIHRRLNPGAGTYSFEDAVDVIVGLALSIGEKLFKGKGQQVVQQVIAKRNLTNAGESFCLPAVFGFVLDANTL